MTVSMSRDGDFRNQIQVSCPVAAIFFHDTDLPE